MADGVLTEQEAVDLVAYLAASAELSVIEPELYGSFRLVDAAARVLARLAERGAEERRESYARLRDEIERKKLLMMWEPESYVAFVRELPADVVERLPTPGPR